jgi:hypothetical protein
MVSNIAIKAGTTQRFLLGFNIFDKERKGNPDFWGHSTGFLELKVLDHTKFKKGALMLSFSSAILIIVSLIL